MHSTKKTWQNIIFISILLVAIILLFRWYSISNSKRIETQNLNYATDAARQAAQSLGNEFINARRRVYNYAYLLGLTMDTSEINTDTLKGLEENAYFDAICFVNADGVNITADGV